MTRVKRGLMHNKRRTNLLKHTKGFRWGRKSKIKLAKVAKMKAGQHAFASRRAKKRQFRQNWNISINAAARQAGTTYSKLIGELNKKNIKLNRKVLVELAKDYKKIFDEVIKAVK
ncbi:MAG TPA: 50S ribosomal protein L20 [Candidatus Magasanikbacteria bacterium]|nr:50S ribosomal protein L20 [Candidatus Magasanikbacteria bacterium]